MTENASDRVGGVFKDNSFVGWGERPYRDAQHFPARSRCAEHSGGGTLGFATAHRQPTQRTVGSSLDIGGVGRALARPASSQFKVTDGSALRSLKDIEATPRIAWPERCCPDRLRRPCQKHFQRRNARQNPRLGRTGLGDFVVIWNLTRQ